MKHLEGCIADVGEVHTNFECQCLDKLLSKINSLSAKIDMLQAEIERLKQSVPIREREFPWNGEDQPEYTTDKSFVREFASAGGKLMEHDYVFARVLTSIMDILEGKD